MSKKISPRLTAVAFAAALTLAGTVEAGPLAAGSAGSEESSWSLALDWLHEVWGDLTGLQSATATESTKPTGDLPAAGCGIDPNGGPLCGDNG
jgi:hypothetical protein